MTFQKIIANLSSLIACCLLSSAAIVPGSAEYALRNYTRHEYLAANQNWAIATDSRGFMYFANHAGLLEFDGVSWDLYPTPGGTTIRAVAADKHDRIYTAGYLELGYWDRNLQGKLEYHSLKAEVEPNFTANEEFWNVLVYNDKVYFQSFSKIYIYDGQRFDIVRPEGFINSMSAGSGHIFVNLMHQGIYELTGQTLKPLLVRSEFAQTEIRFVLSLEANQILIGTSNEGLKCWDGHKLFDWIPSESEYFRKNIINRGIATPDGKIIIGTILDGITIIGRNGKILQQINKGNGLQNNTVLGLNSDRRNNIWVALDKGIDYVSLQPETAYSIFEVNEIGAVYSAAIYHEKLYLGTNQGLYCKPLNQADQSFVLVPATQGQVWDCKIIDDRLFVNHNKGTFEIRDKAVLLISTSSGGFSITENPFVPNSLVQSTYSNLIFYTKESDHWNINRVL